MRMAVDTFYAMIMAAAGVGVCVLLPSVALIIMFGMVMDFMQMTGTVFAVFPQSLPEDLPRRR